MALAAPVLIMTSFATELATPTVADERTYVWIRTYVGIDMYVHIRMDTLPRLIYKDVNARLKKLIAVINAIKKNNRFFGYNYLLTLHASTLGSGAGEPA